MAGSEPFQDPLENYEPRTYDDPLERALAEDSVAEVEGRPFVSVSTDMRVGAALEELADLDVACLLVIDEEDRLAGVFSHRDVLDRVAGRLDEVRDEPIHTVMTDEPVYVYRSDPVAAAVCVMAVSGYRHVPVVDPDRRPVGIVSPQRVLDFVARRASA